MNFKLDDINTLCLIVNIGCLVYLICAMIKFTYSTIEWLGARKKYELFIKAINSNEF